MVYLHLYLHHLSVFSAATPSSAGHHTMPYIIHNCNQADSAVLSRQSITFLSLHFLYSFSCLQNYFLSIFDLFRDFTNSASSNPMNGTTFFIKGIFFVFFSCYFYLQGANHYMAFFKAYLCSSRCICGAVRGI